MNTINRTTAKEDAQIPVKMMLSALWAALMFLYIYADHISLFKPGQIEEMVSGRMGPFPVTQGALVSAAILMLIPGLMIFLCLALKPGVGRWVNIILGVLYTAINVWNLVGGTWAFYLLFGVVEMALTLLIVGYAWRWRNREGRS